MHPIAITKRVITKNGQEITIPIVFVGHAVLSSYARYAAERAHKSLSWHRESSRAVVLLFKYNFAMRDKCSSAQSMFEQFAQTLLDGTHRDGVDETGLWWQPYSSNQTARFISYITSYSEWLYYDTEQKSELLNPKIAASGSEYLINMAAYYHKKNKSFLKHLKNDKQASNDAREVYSVKVQKIHKNTTVPNNRFPPEITDDVIEGFTLPGSRPHYPIHRRLDLAKVLIFMIIRFGGVRVSEPFHLYLDDIQPHPTEKNRLLIKIHHPSDSAAPKLWGNQWITRELYLREEFGLSPRHKATNNYRAGWKNPALEYVKSSDGKKELFFYVDFLSNSERELFYHLWILYLKKQRPKNNRSPFAFLSLKTGMPLSIKSFTDKFEKIIIKLGYEFSASAGTKPHGCRHLYKYECKNRGMDNQIIKRLMHHHSLESQEEYAQPSTEEVRLAIKEGEKKLNIKTQNHLLLKEIESKGLKNHGQ